MADRIVRAVGRPCRLAGGAEVLVRASVGVTQAPCHGQGASNVLNTADEAMYAAKGSGKGSFRLSGRAAVPR